MNKDLVKLKNGLETLFIDASGNKSATVQIWFRAGSALEKKDHEGIAHFLEHMFFKGTQNRPGAKIAEEVESFGGEINAFTSFDYTCYYINTPNTYLSKTVEILLDMVSNPEFKEEDLIPERNVVFEEFRRSIDIPSQFAFHQLQKLCFSGQYSHSILGNANTIKAFDRNQLTSFRQNFYNLSNALLIVAGDIGHNKQKIVQSIESFSMPTGPNSEFPDFKFKQKAGIDVHKKDVRMATMTIAIESSPYHETASAHEDLALNCLSHGESSRFYKALVLDKTLANMVSGSSMFFSHGGMHLLRVAAPAENLKAISNQMIQLFKNVLSEGISDDEIQKIKNQYLASKIYSCESLESYSFSLGHGFAQAGDIHSEEAFIERIRKSTLHDVNKAIYRILSRPIHVCVQLPKKENETLYKGQVASFQKDLMNLTRSAVRGLEEEQLFSQMQKNAKKSRYDAAARIIRLCDGIDLIYRQNTIAPTFAFQVAIKGGLIQETAKNNGAHHLMSELITKGYSNIPHNKIKEDIENKSASLHNFSGKNAYGLTLNGLSENFSDLCEHFFGALLSPDIKPKFIQHEKTLIQRALENQKEDPAKQCFTKVSQIMFPNHPYALDILGSNESLKNLKRETLLNLHFSNLKQNNLVFTYCGENSCDDVLETLHPYIKLLKKKLKAASKKTEKKTSAAKVNAQKTFISFDREQTHIFIGRPAFKLCDKKDIFLKMLTAHLSGQSSELFVDVRDRKGLCYSVQPIHFNALDGGYWGIYIAAGHDKTNAAIEAILELLKKLSESGLSENEVERIKTMISGQSLIGIQTNEDYVHTYSIPALHGLSMDFHYISVEQINKVKHAEFNEFLKSYLKQDFSQVVVGRSLES